MSVNLCVTIKRRDGKSAPALPHNSIKRETNEYRPLHVNVSSFTSDEPRQYNENG